MMKTNAKRKNSAVKKLIPAAGMLALSASMLATSTYAWFTMNKEVTVTGMKIHTVVDSNLLISETNSEASFTNSLTEGREALLEPVSSNNAINFFYTATNNVLGNGDAIAETYTAYNESTAYTSAHTNAGKTAVDTAFNTNYGKTGISAATVGTYENVAYGYLDYTFYLKAVNSDASNAQNIVLNDLTLKYNNGNVAEKAWRAALIVHSASKDTAYDTAWASSDVVSIFTLNGANQNNQTSSNYAVGAATGQEENPSVKALSYGTNATAYNQNGVVGEVAAGATGYYKVTVRLWLEGEDKDCTTSTFATLKSDYTLDLKFCFGDGHSAATYINTPAAQQQGGGNGGN